MTMADRIAVMNEGKLQQIGSSDELYLRPSNVFVASFIGSPPMNMLDAVVVSKNDTCFLKINSFKIKLTEKLCRILKSREKIIIGIRPENIRIGEGPYWGKVFIVEPLGREEIAHISIGEDVIITAFVKGFNVEAGDKIRFNFDIEDAHFFDHRTGMRICGGSLE